MVEDLAKLASGSHSELLTKLLTRDASRTALRYITAPPISEDDLKTLASVDSLSHKRLRSSPGDVEKIRGLLFQVLDPHRFAWIVEGRPPTDSEIQEAVTASSALVAAKKVETSRRSTAKADQEALVKTALAAMGFVETHARHVHQPHLAPEPGEFCGESQFGSTRADLIVRLHDQRIMPIECKASNSAVNSYKRVNHEAANKARQWLTDFGRSTTVPAAVLSGVFKPENLVTAQNAGLSIFWSHRLTDLQTFLTEAT